MPNAPAHPCPRPHCGRLTRNRGACARCAKRADLSRGTAEARGYDAEWALVSRRWLARFPWCGQRADGRLHVEHSRCAQRGERVRARVTDHIVRLRDGGARLDPRNFQSLCVGCNAAKDARRGPRL
jgi:5-methylcytosine-specific restriction endonuclease McrA